MRLWLNPIPYNGKKKEKCVIGTESHRSVGIERKKDAIKTKNTRRPKSERVWFQTSQQRES